ncbi:MAG: prepilin-type N-terminal cleavage/methylation domain-containing protein [Candidatus Gracilibacteria bacterium]|nr:prepilin-type N-terminal cleavage/methylation domain-containing protein [Candidatus Gracilibacteria bacterium]
MKKNKRAFSMIEILVGILIFTMGIISVYSIINTTLNLNDYNKNYIIASYLAREQVELVRNIRDSNYKKIQIYNQLNPSSDTHTSLFEYGKYYKIENDFNLTNGFPISISEISNFGEGESELNNKMQNYRLCLTSDNIYTFDCSGTSDKTQFYKYIKIDKVEYNDGVNNKIIDDAFKVTSKVIWYMRGYHEFELNSIFTDFKRF